MSRLTTMTRMWLTRSLKAFEFSSDYDRRLPYDAAPNLGLYVHIPFCRSICAFCPYCKVAYDESLVEPFVQALLHEIDLVTEGHPRQSVTSLYFGGGTPALLLSSIGIIVARLRESFDITEGIGLELHPRDVTVETLSALKRAGVTRISLGVQSFNPDNLALLGRGETDFTQILTALAAVPFETVAMDFIFALPGQTAASLRRDIDTAFASGANHIALYPFIDFSFTSRGFAKMPDREKRELLDQTCAYLESLGCSRDSIWTFAKPGTKKYSSMTRENFLGFGPSATTLLPDQFKVNTFSIPAYIERVMGKKVPANEFARAEVGSAGSLGEHKAGQTEQCSLTAKFDETGAANDCLPTALTLRFSERQRMVYWLFWTAYTMQVNPLDFKAFFAKTLKSRYGFELLLMQALGMAKKEQNGSYRMTSKGAWYYHRYESHYTLSYIDQMWNLMRKVAFPQSLSIR